MFTVPVNSSIIQRIQVPMKQREVVAASPYLDFSFWPLVQIRLRWRRQINEAVVTKILSLPKRVGLLGIIPLKPPEIKSWQYLKIVTKNAVGSVCEVV